MPKPTFIKASDLSGRIDAYFKDTEGECHMDIKPSKETKGLPDVEHKIRGRDPEVPTIAGLALFLGFNSRQAFSDYEEKGKFKQILKRDRLRIEAIYEKKLHHQSSAGAIFALKSMGWNEKPENNLPGNGTFKSIEIELIETSQKPVGSEKEVVL
jgi:hypothetical protein